MVEVLKREYWSRADAFLLPLTGLNRNETFEMKSYLFWNEYSIEDYQLILTFDYGDDYEEFLQYARTYIFPVLDKKGYLIENYDVGEKSVFILDISEWAMDIESFLAGKYSLLTKEAKVAIEKFHIANGIFPAHVFAVIYPNVSIPLFDDRTAIEYVAENYGINYDQLKKLGEIGSIYDRMTETLLTDINQLCQTDT